MSHVVAAVYFRAPFDACPVSKRLVQRILDVGGLDGMTQMGGFLLSTWKGDDDVSNKVARRS